MRQFIIGVAAATALGVTAASAADLPARAPVYVPAPVFTWAGWYAGVNLGYGWARGEASAPAGTVSGNLNGVTGGGQIGYNWQWTWAGMPVVLGWEADIQGTDQSRDTIVGPFAFDSRITYFGTVRGRLGYAPANWLIYATGGFAYGGIEHDVTFNGVTASTSKTRTGWTVGGGVEWMFMPRWSAKVEYLYLDTGDINNTVLGVPVTTQLRDNVVRAGVNYHF